MPNQLSVWDWDTKAHHDKQDDDERQYYQDKMMELLDSIDLLRRDLDRFLESSQHHPGHEERRLRISRRLSILNKFAFERPVTASPPSLPASMPVEDVERLTSAKERVQRFMADGQWHTASEIREVGGSEGLRRLRELRQDGHVIDKRKVKGGLYEYRVCGWLPWGGE